MPTSDFREGERLLECSLADPPAAPPHLPENIWGFLSQACPNSPQDRREEEDLERGVIQISRTNANVPWERKRGLSKVELHKGSDKNKTVALQGDDTSLKNKLRRIIYVLEKG